MREALEADSVSMIVGPVVIKCEKLTVKDLCTDIGAVCISNREESDDEENCPSGSTSLVDVCEEFGRISLFSKCKKGSTSGVHAGHAD